MHVVPHLPATEAFYEIVVHPSQPDLLLFQGPRSSWLSQDGGRTATQHGLGGYQHVVFHPVESWLLGVRQVEMSWGLFLSQDLGATWTLLKANVAQFNWCRAGSGTVSRQRVCVVAGAAGQLRFQATDDLGATWRVPLDARAFFFYVHERFFTLVAAQGNTTDIYVSADDGASFRRALLPEGVTVGVLQESQFLEDDNGVIFLVASPQGRPGLGSSAGDLYTSDADGYKSCACSTTCTR